MRVCDFVYQWGRVRVCAGDGAVVVLAGNDIGDTGSTSLARAVNETSTLTALDLGGVRSRDYHVIITLYCVDRVCVARDGPVRVCASTAPVRARPRNAGYVALLCSAAGVCVARRVGSHIHAAGATALACALKRNTTITTLSLRRAIVNACGGSVT